MKNRLPTQSSITLSLEGDRKTSIWGDRVLLIWAIENLIHNSIDAIGDSTGKISVIIIKTTNGISLDIKDTGKGIPRKNWKNIFQPGYSSKVRGWGLGLTLTQRIIEEIHGGKIYVKHSKPGETILKLVFQT